MHKKGAALGHRQACLCGKSDPGWEDLSPPADRCEHEGQGPSPSHLGHGCFIAMACVAFADVTDIGARRRKCLATALDNNWVPRFTLTCCVQQTFWRHERSAIVFMMAGAVQRYLS